MIKSIVILLILSILTLCVSCSSKDDQSEISGSLKDYETETKDCDMSHMEFSLPSEPADEFSYGKYIFYRDNNGKNVIVERCIHLCGRYTNAQEFDAVEPTDETFEKIEEGMTVYEVVELVGLPYTSTTFGRSSMVFSTAASKEYSVYFNDHTQGTTDGNMTVQSVRPLEKNTDE